MSEFLFQYHAVSPTTWVYLSSLLMIGLFFKFSRFWSVRNLDLILLILLAPGLLLVHFGSRIRSDEQLAARAAQVEPPAADAASLADAGDPDRPDGEPADVEPAGADSETAGEGASAAGQPSRNGSSPGAEEPQPAGSAEVERPVPPLGRGAFVQRFGYFWLLGAGGLLLLRVLVDPMMVRRPLLLPNLSVGGLTFIGCSLFVFLMANVITDDGGQDKVPPVVQGEPAPADQVVPREADRDRLRVPETGPGYSLLGMLPTGARKTMVILAHLTVVIGMAAVGYRHFDNVTSGIGAATLYLMLPYTALMTGRIDHIAPAALLVCAVLLYRRPLLAGMFLGIGCGVVYYPLFLLPLWLSFYWQRGLVRFVIGTVSMLGVLAAVLAFTSTDVLADIQRMFGLWPPSMQGLEGIWNREIGSWDPVFRLPVLAAFLALSLSYALWPPQKNLGTLLSCSAAVMVATQFWHGFGGGTYMAWYLPLVLLTIFRPNLEDRVALAVLGEGWLPRRRPPAPAVDLAA